MWLVYCTAGGREEKLMSGKRLEIIDLLRGVALAAMTVFHFAFDLELFGIKEQGFISQPHWKYFARGIASSFLILTGFSLFLAHYQGVNWDKWCWRLLKIAGAALLITIATYFATPTQFIFFGILHQIAFASVAGLLFLKIAWPALLLLSVGFFTAPLYLKNQILDSPLWWWSGLQEVTPVSSDYVPVFPWFSAVLIGIAFAKIITSKALYNTMESWELSAKPLRLLKFMGRNSLVYYLLHQPIMIGFLLGALWLTGRLG